MRATADQALSISRHLVAPRAQRGASLVVALALLLAAGLIAATGFGVARGQYALAGNLQFQEQAFQRAEATAATAERWLAVPANAQSTAFASGVGSLTPGLYPVGAMATLGRDPRTMAWNATDSVAAPQGRYYIEQIARGSPLPGASLQAGQSATGACRAVDLFRVVSRSEGTRGSSRMLETLIATDGCRS